MVSRYAHGPGVFVPGRVALLLSHLLKLDEVRVQLRGQDSQTDEVLHDWHLVSLGERERIAAERRLRSSAAGCDESATSSDNRSQLGAVSTPSPGSFVGTAEVAAAADVSIAAVTKAAREGRLAGSRESGKWKFRYEDAATWIARRSTG